MKVVIRILFTFLNNSPGHIGLDVGISQQKLYLFMKLEIIDTWYPDLLANFCKESAHSRGFVRTHLHSSFDEAFATVSLLHNLSPLEEPNHGLHAAAIIRAEKCCAILYSLTLWRAADHLLGFCDAQFFF